MKFIFYIIGILWGLTGLMALAVVSSIVSHGPEFDTPMLIMRIIIAAAILTGFYSILCGRETGNRTKRKNLLRKFTKILIERKFRITAGIFARLAGIGEKEAEMFMVRLIKKQGWKFSLDKKNNMIIFENRYKN